METRDDKIFKWLDDKRIYTDSGEPFEFIEHGFLKDLFTNFNQNIVVKKCSQIGVSLTLLSKILYLADTLDKRVNTLYTLPTDDDVKDFVRTKFDPIVLGSSLSRYAEGVRKEDKVYSIQLKKIANSFFYFRGSKSQSKALSVSIDIWIGDEWDYQDQNIKEMYSERLKGSGSLRINWKVGNPTIPNYGIAKEFEESTQNFWYITCPMCRHVQRLVWPDSIDKERKVYVCRQCQRPLSDEVRLDGKWVPTFPDRKLKGYSFNRLMATWFTAEDVLDDFNNKKIENFYRFVLGESYEGKGINIKTKFKSFLTDYKLKEGKRIIGIDQGDRFFIVSGLAGKKHRIIDYTAIFDTPAEINEMIAELKPELVVMDSLPNKHLGRIFQKQYGKNKFLLANERDKALRTVESIEIDHRLGVVSADRTMVLDEMFEFLESGILKINKKTSNQDTFKDHLSCIVPEEKEIRGTLRRRYKKIGEDHLAFALSFFQIGAAIMVPIKIEKKKVLNKNDMEKKERSDDIMDDKDFRRAIAGKEEEKWEEIKTI